MNEDELRRRFPKASDDFIRRNCSDTPIYPRAMCANPEPFFPEKKRVRQHAGDGMNKWERDYLATLDLQWSHIYREVSLPLANGVRYKVDFLVISTKGERIVVEGHEVKGMARSTGIVKIKIAASLYPWICFRLVTKKRQRDGGGWDLQRILP